MTNKLAPLALPLGAALLLSGQAMAESMYDLKYIAKQVAKEYCSDFMQSKMIGAPAFTRGQIAGFLLDQYATNEAIELTSAEEGRVSYLIRELTLGGYCEPGSI